MRYTRVPVILRASHRADVGGEGTLALVAKRLDVGPQDAASLALVALCRKIAERSSPAQFGSLRLTRA
jgi:hypothetical protein